MGTDLLADSASESSCNSSFTAATYSIIALLFCVLGQVLTPDVLLQLQEDLTMRSFLTSWVLPRSSKVGGPPSENERTLTRIIVLPLG